MKKKQNIDIAFSFSSDDHWIANDLSKALNKDGFNVYFSSNNPDFAGGFLRKELMEIYKESSVNVMLWSNSYKNKPKDSIINLEKSLIWDRHVGKSEYKSLFIINVDSSAIPDDFDNCLVHQLRNIGISSAKEYIVNRLIECYKTEDPKLSDLEHPANCEGHRGKMIPCEFRLSSNYKQDGINRWNTLGDILIVPLYPTMPKALKTFLIPSSVSPPFLSHSTLLKTDARALSIKQKTSIDFFTINRRRNLQGVIFYIEKDGMEYPHTYCFEYDQYLARNWRNHSTS